MPTPQMVLRGAVPVAVALLVLSCGGGSKESTGPGPLASIVLAPDPVTLTALGATQQLTATGKDASGNVITGATITYAATTHGFATVSATGLVTAVAVGTDTVTASAGAITATAPVVVSQAVANIAVTPDTATLLVAGRTRQLAAAASDATGHPITGVAFTWKASDTTVATVNATGLATAVNDGTTQIQASAGGGTGAATVTVDRIVVSVVVRSANGNKLDTLASDGGTLGYAGTATDSSGATIAGQVFSWVSRSSATARVSPATGSSTTATAVGNGSTYVVGTAGTQRDSARLVVSFTLPTTAAVSVGDYYFKSGHNGTENPAVDTIAVGGTVTWTWVSGTHGVQSTGTPSFTTSPTQSSGSYSYTFGTAGTYTYDCTVHGTLMTGQIVVQ